ncbi:MAG TPA: bacteriohemerythrin [Bryobacteraceae bacterium]|nr:bacteriohemerythrin [Bryobacteraceae bacterium]
MPLLSWNDSYSVRAPAIDAQHKHLMKLINDLHDGMSRGAGNDALGSVLDGLIKYTRAHFADEERAMEAAGYPNLLQHRAEHKALTDKVLKFREDFAAGRVAISIHVLTFLKEWLSHHIMGSDKQYAPWLAQHQA